VDIQPLIAVAPPGLEQLVAKEIRGLGGGVGRTRIDGDRIYFEGPPDALIRANLQLSVADRILLPLASRPAFSSSELREMAAELPLEGLLAPGLEIRFSISTRRCRLFHTGAIENALSEGLRAQGVRLPAGDGKSWCTLDVRGTDDRWRVAIDTTGPGLNRRGYRRRTAKAPIRENLAAALLLSAGWDRKTALLDPTCGAGTIVIEAARSAQSRAPGLDRRFAFERFPVLQGELWESIKARAWDRVDSSAGGVALEGADSIPGAIRASVDNSKRAGTAGVARFVQRSLEETPPADGPGLVIFNPPWGMRTGDPPEEAVHQWRRWREVLSAARPGWDVVFVAPHPALAEAMGAQGKALAKVRAGGVAVRFWRSKIS
jgi:putative N6-adenine-specific DNA methylase